MYRSSPIATFIAMNDSIWKSVFGATILQRRLNWVSCGGTDWSVGWSMALDDMRDQRTS